MTLAREDASWKEHIIGSPFKLKGFGRKYVKIRCEGCNKIIETRLDHVKKRIWENTPLYCGTCARRRTYVERTINANLEDWQWAYLAGFLDGEGCVCWSGNSSTPQLSIAQCDKTPLDKFSSWLGTGEMSLDERSKQNENWTDCWHWRMTNCIDILWLLCQVHKYLLVKKDWLTQVVEYLDQRVDLNGSEDLLEHARSLLSK